MEKIHSIYSIFNPRPSYTNRQRILFLRQLQIILRSGIPIVQSLELMEPHLEHPVRMVCIKLISDLYNGHSLSASMRRQKLFFTPLCIALTAAAEECGQLMQLLQEMSDYYQQQEKLNSFLLQAAAYPAIVCCTSFCVMLFFIFYILPLIGSAYTSMQLELGGIAGLLMQAEPIYLLYAVVLLVVIGILIYWHKERIPYKEYWPILGRYFRLVEEIRICKLLNLLLRSGIPLVEAITLTEQAVSIPARGQLRLFSMRLQYGFDIVKSLQKTTKIFSPLTIALLSVGAETGRLKEMLQESANMKEQDLQEGLKQLRQIMAPLLILLAGGITAAVVTSIVEPLFNMLGQMPGL